MAENEIGQDCEPRGSKGLAFGKVLASAATVAGTVALGAAVGHGLGLDEMASNSWEAIRGMDSSIANAEILAEINSVNAAQQYWINQAAVDAASNVGLGINGVTDFTSPMAQQALNEASKLESYAQDLTNNLNPSMGQRLTDLVSEGVQLAKANPWGSTAIGGGAAIVGGKMLNSSIARKEEAIQDCLADQQENVSFTDKEKMRAIQGIMKARMSVMSPEHMAGAAHGIG